MSTPGFVTVLIVPMDILTTRTVANTGVNISPFELQELSQTQE
jgi:hypothetical protein